MANSTVENLLAHCVWSLGSHSLLYFAKKEGVSARLKCACAMNYTS